jgi:hypothetical protein
VFSGNNLIVFYYLNVFEICTDKRGWSLVGVALLEGRDYCIQNFTNGVVISQTNCICELSIVISHEFQAEVCLSDVWYTAKPVYYIMPKFVCIKSVSSQQYLLSLLFQKLVNLIN